jgi:hypothetical protein
VVLEVPSVEARRQRGGDMMVNGDGGQWNSVHRCSGAWLLIGDGQEGGEEVGGAYGRRVSMMGAMNRAGGEVGRWWLEAHGEDSARRYGGMKMET